MDAADALRLIQRSRGFPPLRLMGVLRWDSSAIHTMLLLVQRNDASVSPGSHGSLSIQRMGFDPGKISPHISGTYPMLASAEYR